MAVSHGKNWILSSHSKKSSVDFDLPHKRRLWGRRIGRPLGRDRADALEKILPLIAIPEAKITGRADLDPHSLFTKVYRETWFEIGFGNGEHLVALKDNCPDVAFLGAEPFINGMANFLKNLEGRPLDNIRVYMDDALPVIRSLAGKSLERIYILNPDPWPKSRHHKRRIVSRKNLDEFARILKPDGRLVLATDVDDLAEWMATECVNHPSFEWTAQSAKDWQTPPREWTETRFAFKGRQAGRRQTFLIFKKACQNS